MSMLTPIQVDMLLLAGYVDNFDKEIISDDERVEAILAGRRQLTKRLGVNFDFDLLTWHKHILQDAKLHREYTFQITWKGVQRFILEAAKNLERPRLIALAMAAEKAEKQLPK